jgi:RND family efflux transporter MFP subunit
MVNVSSRVDGMISKLPFKVGQTVHKGDLVVAFDARERKQELAMAEAHLKSARGAAAAAGAEFLAARTRADRRNATVDVGGRRIPLVSGEEASQAVYDAHGAAGRAVNTSGQVSEQRAKIESLKIALEEAELRAPFDGVVTGVYFEVGMNVHATDTVVRIVGGGGALRVRVAVPEEEHRVGPSSRVRMQLDDGRLLDATIARVSPEVDATTRTFLAEGDVNLGQRERSVMFLAGKTVRVTLADAR